MAALPEHKPVLATPIQELIPLFPCLVHVFIEYHMACIGCSFSKFHNVHQALMLHSIDGERAAKIKIKVIEGCGQHSASQTHYEGG